MNNIDFKIYTTEYDHISTVRGLKRFEKINPEFHNEFTSVNPSVVSNIDFKDLSTQSLGADILIIEDEIVHIMKHFKHIINYAKKKKNAKIKSVIACTKYNSADPVITNLNFISNKKSKPKLVVFDFNLTEPIDQTGKDRSDELIIKLATRVVDTDWNSSILPITTFKGLEGRFKDFERYLQHMNFQTFTKEDLEDSNKMFNHLEFHLDRPTIETSLVKRCKDQYERLKFIHKDNKLKSAENLMQRLEDGIIEQEAFDKKFITKNSVKRKNSDLYIPSHTSISTQITNKKDIINELLIIANIPDNGIYENNRFKNLIRQICVFGLFVDQGGHLRCPKK